MFMSVNIAVGGTPAAKRRAQDLRGRKVPSNLEGIFGPDRIDFRF